MEEICDGLSDIYSIEVLPPGRARPQLSTATHALRTAHRRAHTIAPSPATTPHPHAHTHAHAPVHPLTHTRARVRLQMQRDHFHGAQV